jgi:hypothetical protein
MNLKQAKRLRRILGVSRVEQTYTEVPHSRRPVTRLKTDGEPEVIGHTATLVLGKGARKAYQSIKRGTASSANPLNP